jgi:hypothetical protein
LPFVAIGLSPLESIRITAHRRFISSVISTGGLLRADRHDFAGLPTQTHKAPNRASPMLLATWW